MFWSEAGSLTDVLVERTGDIAAVAKAHSIEQLGAAIEQWAETMADRADLLRRTRIALSVMAPVELTAEAAVAAAATDAASGAEVEFDVKLRAVVSYRELRDVDMQLADPLAPNDPDAEDGESDRPYYVAPSRTKLV